MALGGLLGGYLGDMVSGRVNRSALRAVVMSIGFGVAAYYHWSLYGPTEFQIGANEPSRMPARTSENSVQAKFAEFTFSALG
jgi:dipeptide/tripeptide permease